MDTTNFTDDDILYCLENLAGYEPEDIEHDDVEIAIGDDHFGQMSIVRTAELGAMLIKSLTEQLAESKAQSLKEGFLLGYKQCSVDIDQGQWTDDDECLNEYADDIIYLHYRQEVL